MDSPYGGLTASLLGVPSSQKALRARSPPSPAAIRALESTGSGSAYKALRASRAAQRRDWPEDHARTWTRPRRKGLVVICIALLASLAFVVYRSSDFFVLLHFKLRDKMYEDRWITSCYLRKKPMLYIRSNHEMAIVWESNCDREMEIRWRRTPGQWDNSRVKRVRVDSATRFVYQSVLRGMEAGPGEYEILMAGDGSADKTVTSSATVMARHAFAWTAGESDHLDIAVLADNQFNVRTFHRILEAMLSYFRCHTSRSSPTFIIHAGDQVQNPHNLAQWQTDFWDAMTSQLSWPLGQTTPLLQARGNHDWDKTGVNVYTGGSPPRLDWLAVHGRKPRERHVGTYMSYSPHSRCRIIVLDSNLDKAEQVEQEEWLEWELGREEWTRATLRIVVVHVPPFLEYWDRHSWTEGKESEWSIYVRHRLTPLLSRHRANLVISGHQHAYSRGYLPHALHRAFASSNSSASVPAFASSLVKDREWERALSPSSTGDTVMADGTVFVICGGAGGTLDTDRVEDWGFYDASITERYHFAFMRIRFDRQQERDRQTEDSVRRYLFRASPACEQATRVDSLEWRAVDIRGQVMDRFTIEVEWCTNE